VSWYEAAAYAEFAGKSLPSIYHWYNAAITFDAWMSSYIFPLSNFSGRGPARIGSYQGMSRFGTYDMAGNVKEWCWNEAGQSKHYILGGAWDEPAYMFNEPDAHSPCHRYADFGFRCVKYSSTEQGSNVATEVVPSRARNYDEEKPVSDEIFRVYRSLYSYDRTALNPVIESVEESGPEWKKEKLTFAAAYGNERVVAYLFLPQNTEPPYQTIVHYPGGDSITIRSSNDLDVRRIDFIIKSGRAVLWPILKGNFERGDGLTSDVPDSSSLYRDHVICWSKDLGRSIDYLETRSDIDRSRLGYYGFSWGASMGAMMPALEHRLKVSVLAGPGFTLQRTKPEVDQINFAPRVTIPTLMLNGRYDFFNPIESSQDPMYRLLGTPREHKRHVVFEAGHIMPRNQLIKETLDWLDRYLGSVKRKDQ
jgi:dienelactone hydrolase